MLDEIIEEKNVLKFAIFLGYENSFFHFHQKNLIETHFFHFLILFFQKSTSVVADGLEEKLKKLEQTRDYLTTSAGTDNVDISNRSAVNIG